MALYNTVSYNLIYFYLINDDRHKGLIKIGKTSLVSEKSYKQLVANCDDLNYAANQCIYSQTHRAMVDYKLVHTELAILQIKMQDGTIQLKTFDDHAVHDVLRNSGYESKVFNESGRPSEWFEVDLEIAKKAIEAIKKCKTSIDDTQSKADEFKTKIVLRDEQKLAVKKTNEIFKSFDTMLWDCKMRFGKTITAYEFIKENKYKRVIVITHRPAVQDGWKEDHDKIFNPSEHVFIDKTSRSSKVDGKIDYDYEIKLKQIISSGKPFVYFASMQDLRESKRVGGKFNKNNLVFDTKWDLIIVDEAHEGTRTEKGEAVFKELNKCKILTLTGTPYNLYSEFEDNIYAWTYVDEQKAKKEWGLNHPTEKNPYEDLPVMNILTFDLLDKIENSYKYTTTTEAFNFHEFFRTWTGDISKDFKEITEGQKIGDFVHEDDVNKFLDLISNDNDSNNYPFSNDEFRDMFKHTFWIVPGVAEAKALASLMRKHNAFKEPNYKIVNIAGDGDSEQRYDKALHLVKSAIKTFKRTITISCGKLTTGVTVPEWTGIMMLSGSSNSSASGYMQAIFRVQSPGVIEGKQKLNCYVFDFAPDRALKVIAEVHKITHKGESSDGAKRIALGEFINFCPIISCEDTSMKKYDVDSLMRQVKRISVEHAISSGFDDDSIYKTDAGMSLNEFDIKLLKKLSDVVVPERKRKKNNLVTINNHGLTDEKRKQIEKIKNKPKKALTPEQQKLLEKYNLQKAEQRKMFNLLRAVSIRLPMMFYGVEADITKKVKLLDFTNDVDDESWSEYMPTGLSKELFKDIVRYYDEDVVVGAGLRIRRLARAADELPPSIRVQKILNILSKFKNPDKETVLTPWQVVNMHMGDTLGGYNFYNDNYNEYLETPKYVNNKNITKNIFEEKNSAILEINSKSGLYPLYLAYTFYMLDIKHNEKAFTFEEAKQKWLDAINTHIYVLCKTKMARSITYRTLVGFDNHKINAIYLTKLVSERMKDIPRLVSKITNKSTWGKGEGKMEFKAVVGNPPYQGDNHFQIYPYFYLTSIKLGKYVSLIFPTGWQEPKSKNNLALLNNDVIKKDKQIVKINNVQNVFPGIAGAEWVNIILWEKGYDNKLNGKQLIYTNFDNPKEIKLVTDPSQIEKPKEIIELKKALEGKYDFGVVQDITSPLKPYGIRTDILNNYEKYGLKPFNDSRNNKDDICIYCKTWQLKYVPKDYKMPKLSSAFKKFKVLVPYAWGNMSESTGLGGAYSNIVIASPNEACIETFQESGAFDSYKTAERHAKYLLTKFARACLYINKFSQHTTSAWGSVPIQNYKEKWWDKPISELDDELFKKYKIEKKICDFIKNNFQTKDESCIVNYKGKMPKPVLSKYNLEFNMSYKELVEHLLKKYGAARHDYFKDTGCSVKNDFVSRTNEGLICHHIDEDKAIMLSTDKFAAKNPFSYQKAERLVYCNIIEHLLLHIKIAEEPKSKKANKDELQGIGGAVHLICRQINDYYNGHEFKQEYLINIMNVIKNDFDDYIKILKHLYSVIDSDPLYSMIFKKEDLTKNWDGEIVQLVADNL